MHIECIHQIDASEPDSAGFYEYHYEYDIYRFTEGAVCFVARSYTEEPDKAHFLRVELNENPRLLMDADLLHPLFLAAEAYLRECGKVHLQWLSGRGNGYEPVPSSPLHSS